MKARCPSCYAIVSVKRENAESDHYRVEDHYHLEQNTNKKTNCPGSGELVAGFKVVQDAVS